MLALVMVMAWVMVSVMDLPTMAIQMAWVMVSVMDLPTMAIQVAWVMAWVMVSVMDLPTMAFLKEIHLMASELVKVLVLVQVV
jgi:hypothetical protein